jgi:hypothetical protein
MTTDDQLREIINRRNNVTATLRWVKVLNVDEKNGTMDVKGVSDDLEYFDVSLGCGSVVMMPEKDSLCVIAVLEGVDTECLLISAEKVERVKVKTSTEIVFNEGKLGGLVKVQDLTEVLNNIVMAYNLHTHTVIGNASLPPAISLDLVNREKIENKNIKQ